MTTTQQAPEFPMALQHIDLDISGMTCASCANRIEKKLNKVEGVTATVNYALETAAVAHPASVSVDDLIDVVRATGYDASIPVRAEVSGSDEPAAAPTGEDNAVRTLRNRMIVAIVSAVPVIAMAMVPALQFPGWQWISLALAWPVVTWGAWPFHKAAWTNLRHGAATMDTLISLGVIASFGWSVIALVYGTAGTIGMTHPFRFVLERGDQLGNIYLEAAVGIVTFLLVGRFLEARSKRDAGAALRALLDLGAKQATVLRHRGGHTYEELVPIEQLVVGDKFVVRPGEKIATDGTVSGGHSAVDTAMVTGESVPVEVTEGSTVIGGTINTTGRLVIRADKVGADTQLAQIADLVRKAQTGKAEVQRLADRISGVFVPIVIALALATLGFWLGTGAGAAFAVTSAVAVLIIACPCALGLATPTALMVGTGRGAQLGILLRGPEALEATRRIDAILIDKTGTLTTGAMTVAGVHPVPGTSESELVTLAAAVEAGSEHPLARAVVAAAESRGIAESSKGDDPLGPPVRANKRVLPGIRDFHNSAGLGVSAVVELADGTRPTVRVARADTDDAELTEVIESARRTGQTPVMVWRDDIPVGVIAIADEVRDNAASVVAQLKGLGLEPVLLTGDHETAARAVAAKVGIDTVIAGVMPADKAEAVTSLQAKGKKVAMVGDGVNDAAALAAADLGIAMGGGTDVAIQASDLTLVRNDLAGVVDGIRLARATWRTIVGNLVWAFGYNVAAIPLAAAGLLNPMFAGAAMALSSILVVANSLRLRAFRPTAG